MMVPARKRLVNNDNRKSDWEVLVLEDEMWVWRSVPRSAIKVAKIAKKTMITDMPALMAIWWNEAGALGGEEVSPPARLGGNPCRVGEAAK